MAKIACGGRCGAGSLYPSLAVMTVAEKHKRGHFYSVEKGGGFTSVATGRDWPVCEKAKCFWKS